MPDWFLDSSAIIKRYIVETGTNWVQSITDPAGGNRVLLSGITGVEVVAAITRRIGAGIVQADAAAAITDFRHDLANEYWVIEVLPGVLTRAMILAENHRLRGYDAVQLAAAFEDRVRRLAAGLPSLTFVSADHALNAAAQAEGFMVDDPNLHP